MLTVFMFHFCKIGIFTRSFSLFLAGLTFVYDCNQKANQIVTGSNL